MAEGAARPRQWNARQQQHPDAPPNARPAAPDPTPRRHTAHYKFSKIFDTSYRTSPRAGTGTGRTRARTAGSAIRSVSAL